MSMMKAVLSRRHRDAAKGIVIYFSNRPGLFILGGIAVFTFRLEQFEAVGVANVTAFFRQLAYAFLCDLDAPSSMFPTEHPTLQGSMTAAVVVEDGFVSF